MSIARLLASRLAQGVAVLWAAATLTFLMMHVTSGDTAVAILGGPDAMPTAEQIAKVRAEYGLDKPLLTQYGGWLWRLLHGDLGESYPPPRKMATSASACSSQPARRAPSLRRTS
jgi:peptide/nickel transport system permease protein